ncbi:MAG: TRCF domain-containing protein [Segetibacter sp.]
MIQTKNSNDFKAEMLDRFGPVPQPVEDLFTTVRCRKIGAELGFEKMSLKDNTLKCYFINRPDSPYFESEIFKNILGLFANRNKQSKAKTGR